MLHSRGSDAGASGSFPASAPAVRTLRLLSNRDKNQFQWWAVSLVDAGLYNGPTGKVPKIQLFTIEELFAGKKPQIPLMERGLKAATREERDDQSEFDL